MKLVAFINAGDYDDYYYDVIHFFRQTSIFLHRLLRTSPSPLFKVIFTKPEAIYSSTAALVRSTVDTTHIPSSSFDHMKNCIAVT
jgi:hypothetical protein